MRHLKPGTALFTSLLGALVSLQIFGITITLPILPTVTTEFDTTPEATQLTISAFLAGIALSQLLHGALTDRFGRKPVLIGGIGLYAAAAAGCAMAGGIAWLIGLRVLQGVGAAAGMVVGRAIVRDLFEGVKGVQMMSHLGMLMSVSPLVAPLIGGWLLPFTGWRGIFVVLAVASALVVLATALLLDESIRQREPDATDPLRLLASCRLFLATPGCAAFAMMGLCVNGAMYGYSATSSFVLMKAYGVSSASYGWFLAITASAMILGSATGDRLARTRTIRRMLDGATAWGLGASLLVLACTQLATRLEIGGDAGIALIIGPMVLYALMLGPVFANTTMAGLHPVPQIAGVASAMLGMSLMGGAAFFVWLGGRLFDGSPSTIGYGILLGGAGNFLIYRLFGRPHAPDRK